jgi:hypothetical protein
MVNEFVHKLLQVFRGQFVRIYQQVFAVGSDFHFKRFAQETGQGFSLLGQVGQFQF